MSDGDDIIVLPAGGKRGLRATVIHIYERDTIENPTSAPTFRNMAIAALNAVPRSTRVALLHAKQFQMLLLIEAAHLWFDSHGERCVVMSVEEMRRNAA